MGAQSKMFTTPLTPHPTPHYSVARYRWLGSFRSALASLVRHSIGVTTDSKQKGEDPESTFDDPVYSPPAAAAAAVPASPPQPTPAAAEDPPPAETGHESDARETGVTGEEGSGKESSSQAWRDEIASVEARRVMERRRKGAEVERRAECFRDTNALFRAAASGSLPKYNVVEGRKKRKKFFATRSRLLAEEQAAAAEGEDPERKRRIHVLGTVPKRGSQVAADARLRALREDARGVREPSSWETMDCEIDEAHGGIRTLASRSALDARTGWETERKAQEVAARGLDTPRIVDPLDSSNRIRNALKIRRMRVYLDRLAARKAYILDNDRHEQDAAALGEIYRVEAKTKAKLNVLSHVFEQKYGCGYEDAIAQAGTTSSSSGKSTSKSTTSKSTSKSTKK